MLFFSPIIVSCPNNIQSRFSLDIYWDILLSVFNYNVYKIFSFPVSFSSSFYLTLLFNLFYLTLLDLFNSRFWHQSITCPSMKELLLESLLLNHTQRNTYSSLLQQVWGQNKHYRITKSYAYIENNTLYWGWQ